MTRHRLVTCAVDRFRLGLRSERRPSQRRSLSVTFRLALAGAEVYTRGCLSAPQLPPAAPTHPPKVDGRGRWKRTPAQRAKLQAWGRKWGAVGHEWKLKHKED